MPNVIMFERFPDYPENGYIVTTYERNGEIHTYHYTETAEALVLLADYVRRGYHVISLGNKEYMLTLDKLMLMK